MPSSVSPAIIALLAVLTTSCSSFYSSSPEEKFATYSEHRDAWKHDHSPKSYGLARSVQIIQGSKVSFGNNRLAYTGGLGMATLITTDGYALTAAHVIKDPPLDSFIAFPNSETTPGPTIHVHRQTFKFTPNDPSAPPTKVNFGNKLVAYSPDLDKAPNLPVNTTTLRKIRIIKSFPERDIALIKLPLKTTVCFNLRREPLSTDDTLFASGNWATPFRGTSAGKVTSINTNHPAAIVIRTTVPLAKGDSGGPIFDADGKLVGIASRVIPSQILPIPKLRHSSLRTLNPNTINTLIANDRKRHQ